MIFAESAAAGTGQLGGLAGWAVGVMESLGGFGAALLIALENLFPPLPSEVILPLAGFTASQGELGLTAVILWCTSGSVVGAWALYAVGAVLGRHRTRAVVERLPLVNVEDVDRAEDWFHRHGRGTVFLGRMVPVFRSVISIPAGVTRMPLGWFTALTAAGSLVWNSVLVLAGYWLGEQWQTVQQYVGILTGVVVVVLVLLLVRAVVRRVREKKTPGHPGA